MAGRKKRESAMKLPNGHLLASADRKRIRCDHPGCSAHAIACEYMHWSCGPGVSFFNFCETHWRTPGPYGDTPEERASR